MRLQRPVGSVSCHPDVLHNAQAVLATALEAYIAVDADARVVGWNPAAYATFGHRRDQACGADIIDLIIPGRDRARRRSVLGRLHAGAAALLPGQRQQITAMHHDGHEFPIEMTLSVTDTPAGRILHVLAHDVTTAVRASRFSAVEAAVSRGLAEADSSCTAARRVVEALGVKMGWPVTELWLVDDERQTLRCAARHVTGHRTLGRFDADELEFGIGLPGRVHAHAAAKWIPDLAADTQSVRSRAADAIGLHVAVGVPVCTGSSILGALCVYGDRVEDPEDTLIALLSGVAAHVGQYLERRRAEELTVELARTKDEFVVLVTHELCNPLSVIAGIVDVFSDELDELSAAQQRQYLLTIGRNVQRLTLMAEDLLDLGRLESGHLAIDPVATDLSDIITAAVHDATTTTAAKHLNISIDVPVHLPLCADPNRLRQVADNLISNAIKYTPHGGTIRITAGTDGADAIRWEVADTGIGIPAAERPRLFRRFYRASTALDRRIPGTGLGLVITRAIIDRHHGSITVTDHPGPGTTFTIRLPAKHPPPETGAG
jgi:PAS domain S-box-containing protein